MVLHCAIKHCQNTQKGRNFTFFRFPKDKFYRDAWLNVCSKNVKSLENAKICSIHFRPEFFQPRSAALEYIDQVLNRTPRRMLKLTPTAIPTENLSENDSIIGEIEDNEAVEEYLSEPINNLSHDDGSSEEINIDSENLRAEITSDTFDCEVSFEFANSVSKHEPTVQILNVNGNQQDETLPQILYMNDNVNHQPAEDNNSFIDRIFSALPDCNFSTKKERENYLKHVDQIKQEINTKMMELQADIEKERLENQKQSQEIEILKAKRRKEYNHFLIQFLQAKKNKMYWKKKCLAYKIKFYETKNKE